VRRALITITLALAITFSALAQNPAATTAPSFPAYPNSPAGLENLIVDMLNLERTGDKAGLAPFFRSLVLPHAKEWFISKFGDQGCGSSQMAANDCLGPRLAVKYASTARTLAASTALTLSDLLDEKLTNVEAVNYSEPCSSPLRIVPARKLVGELTTTPILSPVLSRLMQNHEPVYVLWAYSDTQETTVAFFVYSEGAFRYIGMPYPATWADFAKSSTASQNNGETLQPGGSELPSDDLTNEVLDVQPVRVDPSLIQRTVVLHVIIEPDGSVSDASYVRGPAEFKDDAIQSVKERNFGPQAFAGHPIRSDMCISVDVQH